MVLEFVSNLVTYVSGIICNHDMDAWVKTSNDILWQYLSYRLNFSSMSRDRDTTYNLSVLIEDTENKQTNKYCKLNKIMLRIQLLPESYPVDYFKSVTAELNSGLSIANPDRGRIKVFTRDFRFQMQLPKPPKPFDHSL